MSRRSLRPTTHRSPPAHAAHCTSDRSLAHAPEHGPTDGPTDRLRTSTRASHNVNGGHPLPSACRLPAHGRSTVHRPTRRQTPIAIWRPTPSIAARRHPSSSAKARPRPPTLANDLRGPPARQSPSPATPRPPSGPHAHVQRPPAFQFSQNPPRQASGGRLLSSHQRTKKTIRNHWTSLSAKDDGM